ncbi:MAG: hypothetical protein JXQ29_16405 [Planctomycetes bacterium]|nr:hypothetical protein [Planctomycetota bacterium]
MATIEITATEARFWLGFVDAYIEKLEERKPGPERDWLLEKTGAFAAKLRAAAGAKPEA